MMGDRPRILLAADGPVATRIVASARAQGFETMVAAAQSGWSSGADVALEVDPRDTPRLVAAAMDGGADILHPGLGGRAQDPVLAREAVAAGLGWAGGRIGELEDAEDRLLLNRIARDAGIEILPGERFDTRDLADAWIRRYGAPLVVRPGDRHGRGPGLLYGTAGDLPADPLFGGPPWLVERVWPAARRVGVVLVGDGEGDALVVGELEQVLDGRGHVSIAVAPPPGLTMRGALREGALRFAERAWPMGLATIWFSVAADGHWAFADATSGLSDGWAALDRALGIDLVHFQLAVVAGESLGWSSDDVRPRREAVEVVVRATAAGTAVGRSRKPWIAPSRPTLVRPGDEVARAAFDAPTGHAAVVKAVAALRKVPVEGVPTDAERLAEQLVARWS